MLVKLFGLVLANGVLLTSVMMFAMGRRFQTVEAAAYGGDHRPWWFWTISLMLVALYLSALVSFIQGPKTWAGWLLMVIIPAGWAIKGALIVFNRKGRQTVSAIEGDAAWIKIGLIRLPLAMALAGLAMYA